MAVLVRISAQMREIEDRFVTLGLPYRVIGGPRFYERAEIRDALRMTRKHVVPLAEYWDAHKLTIRNGDVRTAGPEL